MPTPAASWRPVLTLDQQRNRLAGSADDLRAAIGRGADLRLYSEFRHNEHIEPGSANDEVIQETMDLRATYLLDRRWCAGLCTLRQPIALPAGFGPRPSLSFFLYNEDGQQAIARPFLDGPPAQGRLGPSALNDYSDMPKYHEQDNWDAGTNAPSSNFIYDFEVLRYFVREDWTEALQHTAQGEVLRGSLDDLVGAFTRGAEIKVGIQGLCDDLTADPAAAFGHEVFIQAGPCYFYTRQRLLLAATHPVVRVRPGVPLRYSSCGWDFGWLLVRSDGQVARLLYDPYTLRPGRSSARYAVRWLYR
jgi:hypothetical protein